VTEPAPDMTGKPRVDYGEHTWLELRELAERDDIVCVIPAATLEDHGYHLPIDTDVRLVEAITRGAVERFNAQGDAKALLCPTQVHGYTPHHLDFPGSVTLRWNVFVESLLDQGRSLIHHGFDRILIVNGHGSNIPLVNMAARLLNVEHRDAVCASSFYLTSEESMGVLQRHRTSGPGGMAHACELETSLYLAIRPDLVQMDRAVTEIPASYTPHVFMDWSDGPLSLMPHWSAITTSGVTGDAAAGTAEKGRIWLEQAQKEIAAFIGEVATRPHAPGVDHH
jgi:creatinine amidohydrolase